MFHASKNTNKNNQKIGSCSCSNYSEESNVEEEANFVRNLKWGTNKFKVKIPLKCFHCGKVGHFSFMCSYEKGLESDDEEETPRKEMTIRKEIKANFRKRKIFIWK